MNNHVRKRGIASFLRKRLVFFSIIIMIFGFIGYRYISMNPYLKRHDMSYFDVDALTFKALNNNYAVDKFVAYFKGQRIRIVGDSFEALNEQYAKDAVNIYYGGIPLFEADRDSFIAFDEEFAKDKNNKYYKDMFDQAEKIPLIESRVDFAIPNRFKKIDETKSGDYKITKVASANTDTIEIRQRKDISGCNNSDQECILGLAYPQGTEVNLNAIDLTSFYELDEFEVELHANQLVLITKEGRCEFRDNRDLVCLSNLAELQRRKALLRDIEWIAIKGINLLWIKSGMDNQLVLITNKEYVALTLKLSYPSDKQSLNTYFHQLVISRIRVNPELSL